MVKTNPSTVRFVAPRAVRTRSFQRRSSPGKPFSVQSRNPTYFDFSFAENPSKAAELEVVLVVVVVVLIVSSVLARSLLAPIL